MAGDQQLPETVSQVDLKRYVGTWYEIARVPNWFQDQCVGNVTADYKQLGDGNIEVINRCLDETGMIDEVRGVARIIDASTNAKLEVSFISLFGLNLFWGDYWILDLDPEYQWAVIGEPKRKYLWILSRAPTLDQETLDGILSRLPAKGYEADRLNWTLQDLSP